MTALARTKAEPSDPIRGVMNDFADYFGLPRAEDLVGVPADWAEKMGAPTPRELIPTPADALNAGIKGMGSGRLPSLPRPPAMPAFPMFNPADTFPAPVPGDMPGYGQPAPAALPPPPPPLFPRFGQGYYYQDAGKRDRVRRR